MINLFSYLLHDEFIDNFDLVQDKLIDFCYQEKEKFTVGLQVSNGENAWHSEKEYYKKNNILSETVQLFLNSESEPKFKEMVNSLQDRYNTDNLTDTVYKAIENEYNNS